MTSADPLVVGSRDPSEHPDASNQAIPTLIATRDRDRFHLMFPRLRIEQVDWFSLVVYPLTGGFKPWSLISEALARRALRLERVIEPVIGQAMAFRMMLVVGKQPRIERWTMSEMTKKTALIAGVTDQDGAFSRRVPARRR